MILLFVIPSTAATYSKALPIYFIDVEGGQATLVVTPHGESMLIDAGFPGLGGRDSPGLEDLWQLHYSIDSDVAHNTDERLIANTDDNCDGQSLRVSASTDGTFIVFNSCNRYSRTYKNDHRPFQTVHGKQMLMSVGR